MSSVIRLRTRPAVEPVAERAFAEEHVQKLRAFALIIALGDARAATAAADSALREGGRRAGSGRPPPSADAWLRHRVLRTLHPPARQLRRTFSRDEVIGEERRSVLRRLGASDVALEGLTALSPVERAAVVAAWVERLEPAALQQALGLGRAASRRVLARGFRKYTSAADAILREKPWARRDPPGDLARRVDEAAQQPGGGGAGPGGERAEHRRFREWLSAASVQMPDPASAAHATECVPCSNAMVGLDALAAVDTGRPPAISVDTRAQHGEGSMWMMARYLAPPAVVMVLALTQVIGGQPGVVRAPGAWFATSPTPQANLGIPGAGTVPTENSEGSSTDDDSTSDGGPSSDGAGGTANIPPGTGPTDPGAPFAPASSIRPSLPVPGAGSSPSPGQPMTPPPGEPTSPPPGDPTAAPPPPTPDPTPGGLLPECADLVDNDGDGAIDLLDLGCLDSLDLTEN